ncbi:MAG: arylesterase [Hyphomicrobiales bacterium]|nr:arylesterase [Hyphomicrobiales bacterium]
MSPVQGWTALALAVGLLATASAASAQDRTVDRTHNQTVRIVVLGDSITSGQGLAAAAALPARLQAALRAEGIPAEIVDAGVSGDTAVNGLARLDWAVPEGTDGVIVALGANDMLRGIDPAVTRKALDDILRRLRTRGIPVLLAGMRSAPNLGTAFGESFEAVYPELAAKYDVLLYPFLLEGVAANGALNQPDGIHPNAAGVDRIVAGMLPKVKELITRARRASSAPAGGRRRAAAANERIDSAAAL